jgi:hypothetical protein
MGTLLQNQGVPLFAEALYKTFIQIQHQNPQLQRIEGVMQDFLFHLNSHCVE